MKTNKQWIYKSGGRNIVSENSFTTILSDIKFADKDIHIVAANQYFCGTPWKYIINSKENQDKNGGNEV